MNVYILLSTTGIGNNRQHKQLTQINIRAKQEYCVTGA
jgi:hypothetical protein